jgi:radical SAM domain protein
MKEMLSQYVHLFQSDGRFYLYNSQNNFFSAISRALFSQLMDRRFDLLSQDTHDLLKEKLILINESQKDDYYLSVKFKYYAGSFSTNKLSIVLVPTTGCNFMCPYCFEKEKTYSTMSDDVINGVISFINNHHNAKSLDITWYGGEPLIGLPVIKKIYSKITKETPIPLSRQAIVTNGYLINKDVILFFRNVGINFVQITIDGVRENHNKTRFLLSRGGCTYDVIISNIESLLELYPECRVSLRVNVNKKNKEDFIILYKQLHKKWSGRNLYIYPGFIREDAIDKLSFSTQCITPKERLEFYASLRERGVNINLFPKHCSSRGCMINSLNSYIIGPTGEIYKCWNDVSSKAKVIGNICESKLINEALLFKYACDCSPFEDECCKDCYVFPICQGGCGWYRFRNKYQGAKFDICSIYKDKSNLERALLLSLNKYDKEYPELDL